MYIFTNNKKCIFFVLLFALFEFTLKPQIITYSFFTADNYACRRYVYKVT